jgi:hypothetical protein
MGDVVDFRIRQLELAAQVADTLAAKPLTSGSREQMQHGAKENLDHWLDVFDQAFKRIVEVSKFPR